MSNPSNATKLSKPGSGGKREGAGRTPGVTKKSFSYSLPIELGQQVASMPKPSLFVQKAIEMHLYGPPAPGKPDVLQSKSKTNPFNIRKNHKR